MNDMNEKNVMTDRIRALHRERVQLLSLPPEKALDRILEAPYPAALVHSMPEEDFYFLVHDIGLDDALPLLSLASDTQMEYILDVEGWHQDRIQMPTLTKWLELMMCAQPQRFVSWLVEEKTEFTEFFLHKTIQLVIREHDEDPSDFGDDFFTFDDVLYVRLLRDVPTIEGDETDETTIEESKERRLSFLRRLLNRIADNDHVWYQHLMLNATGVLPAEAEEELYRLRNIRLAEKGFLPFDEAIGVYQPLSAKDLIRQPAKALSCSGEEAAFLPVPHYPVGMLGGKTPFFDALRLVDSDTQLEQLQMEFALLCNQIIAADQRLIRDKAVLREMVRKACGYLSLGLEALTAASGFLKDSGSMASRWATCVTRFPLSQIFRVGYGRVLHSKWQVQGWQKKAWFTANSLPLSFWGERWMGLLGGLLIKKPQFFDNYQSDRLYREFESLSDINATEKAIAQIMAVDDLLSRMDVPCRINANSLLTYKNLLLTLWARQYLTLSKMTDAKRRLAPLTRDEFIRFFRDLFGVKSEASPRTPRKTVKAMKASFLNWLSESSADSPALLTERLGPTLEALFDEMDAELGAVGIRDLDPRFIFLFHIK
jgi:hypothetical protein